MATLTTYAAYRSPVSEAGKKLKLEKTECAVMVKWAELKWRELRLMGGGGARGATRAILRERGEQGCCWSGTFDSIILLWDEAGLEMTSEKSGGNSGLDKMPSAGGISVLSLENFVVWS